VQLKRSDSYDSRNNLALLRLFQFYPTLTNKTVVEDVLMKALTNLPEPCFQHALCLLPQAVVRSCQYSSFYHRQEVTLRVSVCFLCGQQKKPTIAYLVQLERYLQTGQFKVCVGPFFVSLK